LGGFSIEDRTGGGGGEEVEGGEVEGGEEIEGGEVKGGEVEAGGCYEPTRWHPGDPFG